MLYSVLAIFLDAAPEQVPGHAVVIGIFLGPELFAELMDKWNATFGKSLRLRHVPQHHLLRHEPIRTLRAARRGH